METSDGLRSGKKTKTKHNRGSVSHLVAALPGHVVFDTWRPCDTSNGLGTGHGTLHRHPRTAIGLAVAGWRLLQVQHQLPLMATASALQGLRILELHLEGRIRAELVRKRIYELEHTYDLPTFTNKNATNPTVSLKIYIHCTKWGCEFLICRSQIRYLDRPKNPVSFGHAHLEGIQGSPRPGQQHLKQCWDSLLLGHVFPLQDLVDVGMRTIKFQSFEGETLVAKPKT